MYLEDDPIRGYEQFSIYPERLRKLYELWTKLQPHNIKAHKELAEAYEEIRDLDKSLEQLLIVSNMTPSDFNVLSDSDPNPPPAA
jgi:hypothetical protein